MPHINVSRMEGQHVYFAAALDDGCLHYEVFGSLSAQQEWLKQWTEETQVAFGQSDGPLHYEVGNE